MPVNIEHPSALLKPGWVETIRKNAPEAEKLGKLHPAQLELVYQQQWFNLLSPKQYGGLETPLPKLIKTEEALAWADGSLGWVVTLCCGAGWFGGFIDPNIAQQIYSDKQACLAGSGAPTGTATISGEGYIITGSWKYASGVHHATYITVNCNIIDGDKPILDTDGNQLILPFVLDRKDVQLLSGWKYIGMIATGSDAYSVSDLYVDKSRCFKIDANAAVIYSLLYTYPFLQLAEATLAANLSGLAVHFIDLCKPAFDFKATNIRRVDAANILVMDEALQLATELLNQARATFFDAVETSWNNPQDEALLKEVSNTSRVLAKIARESVDELFPYCGLLAASPDTEINRVWRDLHTASQHSLLTFLD
ncbi:MULTISPECIES: acyl-CoA dehydrogenase [unclassified Mucilaginibacter]|uniref:acyl-CoA dehydrogenase n=1 Tax=unclassified Mucilaginibacter TaxID=2617802 RepID=UPI002AC8FEFB|nr:MULTISPECIES: acyl-CoA dehydrogenase [unclassified Mucilaginibacter]MEB0248564.1 acyl-CoA dehydrogenase [Mucilaginibacter sp. 5B2]MEB0262556.1 acyl-CoA dehydrogenase [Mucilaginibacter sp. 10I4]MEB0278413.1 acyl-CoA dehydrogenase [Mucilaginibacter sp. 10B2]MEB0302228.1 acyl-CoA dehydrogenase [Mucilaginibacter sp. 5C4]WPX24058.1 acyl-CoA dehydrogenase [Mucilaginibacter sp. 5C4]